MIFSVLCAFFSSAVAQSGGCLNRVDVGSVCACAGIPSDGKYFLTSFDDGRGASSCSCGSCYMYGSYFLAGRSRFGCGARVKICRGSKCVVAAVTDFGPGCRIDTNAGGPVIDASPNVCSYLFGTTSCGWSDHYSVTGTVVASGTALGPSSGNSVPVPVNNGGNTGGTSWGACNGIAGNCQDTSSACSSAYISGKCPGPSNIKCCPTSNNGGNTGNNNVGNNNGGSAWGACNGVAGNCQDVSSYCARSYLSGKCPGPSNIRCCPSSGGAMPMPIANPPNNGVGTGSCAGLIFPLASGSLSYISVNWGGSRQSGARCHAGIDIYTKNAKRVVAIADGVVTKVSRTFITCKCTGSSVAGGAVLVYHQSIGKTVNYGEITASNIQVSVGQSVTRGQFLGTASACCMLHFELYQGRVSTNTQWYPASGRSATNPDGCTKHSMSTKPGSLLDPRPLIQCLRPSGASLLEDEGVDGELDGEDEATIGNDGELSVGIIVLIAIIVVLVLAALVACAILLARRRQQHDEVAVVNQLFATADATSMKHMTSAREQTATTTAVPDTGTISARPFANDPMSSARFDFQTSNRFDSMSATTGQYKCAQCSNTYHYAEDLAAHVKARHDF